MLRFFLFAAYVLVSLRAYGVGSGYVLVSLRAYAYAARLLPVGQYAVPVFGVAATAK